MSCDVALAFALHLASASNPAPAALWTAFPAAPTPVAVEAAANPLAREPLFAEIVRTAGALEVEADGLRHRPDGSNTAWRAAEWTGFKTRTLELAQLDMRGHLELARRGSDGDLKCILRGISQDLPRKLDDVEAATDATGRRTAFDELFYLLRDNVETLTAPPRPPV